MPNTTVRLLLYLVAAIILSGTGLSAGPPDVPYDQTTTRVPVASLDGLEAPACLWKLAHGDLQEASLDRVMVEDQPALKLHFRTKPDNGTWITFSRTFDPPQDWSQATEIQIMVKVATRRLHWFSVQIEDGGGARYSKPFDAQHFETDWETKAENFSTFKPPKGKSAQASKPDLARIKSIMFTLGPGKDLSNDILIKCIRVARAATGPKALLLVSDHPRHNVFRADEKAGLTAYVRRADGANRLQLSLTDYFGQTVSQESCALTPGLERRFELPAGKYGHFTAHGKLLQGEQVVAEDEIFMAVLPPEPDGFRGPHRESPFGLLGTSNTHSPEGWHPGWWFYPDLGLKWTGYYMDWSQWEPQPGQWKLPDPAQVRAEFERQGVNFHCSPFQTPRWANNAPPDDDRWMRWPPKDWAAWAVFCRKAAQLFPQMALPGPRVYELWPEPIYPWGWKGTTEELARLYKESAKVIHETDPAGLVFGYVEMGNHIELTRALFELGVYETLDGVTTHAYQPGSPEECGFAANIRELRLLMRKYGKEKPIWFTEQGWTTGPGNMVDVQRQAQWWVRKIVQSLSEGVGKYIGFYLADFNSPDHPLADTYGLMYNLDLKHKFGPAWVAPKPAFCAYAALTRALFEAKYAGELPRPQPDLRAYAFQRREKVIVVAWVVTGECAYQLSAQGVVSLMDLMGNVTDVRPRDGKISVHLSPSPVYLTGISPEVLKDAHELPDEVALEGIRRVGGAVELSVEPRKIQLRPNGRAQVAVIIKNQRNIWFDAELRVKAPKGWPQPAPQAFKINNLETAKRVAEIQAPSALAGGASVQFSVWSAGQRLAESAIEIVPVK